MGNVLKRRKFVELSIESKWVKVIANACHYAGRNDSSVHLNLDNNDFQVMMRNTPLPYGLNDIPYSTRWNDPIRKGPSRLCEISVKIHDVFKRNQWVIEDCIVEFVMEGSLDKYLDIYVRSIRGPDFIIVFEEQRGVDYVMIPGLILDYISNDVIIVECKGTPCNDIENPIRSRYRYWLPKHDDDNWSWVPLPLEEEDLKDYLIRIYEDKALQFLVKQLTHWERIDVLKRKLLDPLPFVLQVLILDYGVPEI